MCVVLQLFKHLREAALGGLAGHVTVVGFVGFGWELAQVGDLGFEVGLAVGEDGLLRAELVHAGGVVGSVVG